MTLVCDSARLLNSMLWCIDLSWGSSRTAGKKPASCRNESAIKVLYPILTFGLGGDRLRTGKRTLGERPDEQYQHHNCKEESLSTS
jgi:hypothetical protein